MEKIYLECISDLNPASSSSIAGARDGDQVYLGTTVTCNVDANPRANYSWLDVTYGNTTNNQTIQIWHSGQYKCNAWNRAAATSLSINVTTYSKYRLNYFESRIDCDFEIHKIRHSPSWHLGIAVRLTSLSFARRRRLLNDVYNVMRRALRKLPPLL